MRNLRFMRGMIVASALALAATPAIAGDEERARAAIAEAQGKIEAANHLDADKIVPGEIAQAVASLRLAQEELKGGHEQKAIRAALEAQAFADTALGHAQQRQAAAANAQNATITAAQQQAADANARADAAEQAAASAQQAAAAAQADAAAARATPPVVVAAADPAPVTTVTTETTKAVAPANSARKQPVRRTVKRTTTAHAQPRVTETTRTTVTTTPQ